MLRLRPRQQGWCRRRRAKSRGDNPLGERRGCVASRGQALRPAFLSSESEPDGPRSRPRPALHADAKRLPSGQPPLIPMARHCSLSAKATSLTTRIPAQKSWFSIEPPRCARARESRRQRTSTFSGNEMVLSESTRLSEEAKAPGCIYADRNQLEATINTSIAPMLRKRGEQSVGLHAARQRRLVE